MELSGNLRIHKFYKVYVRDDISDNRGSEYFVIARNLENALKMAIEKWETYPRSIDDDCYSEVIGIHQEGEVLARRNL